MMEDVFMPVLIVGMIFVGLPWVILHYVTKWKTSATLTSEDENMLESLHDTARRLEERLITVERIVAADNPDFTPSRGTSEIDPAPYRRSN